MTEFEFLEELEASQKSFEKLNYIFIRDMHKYIRKSTVYDSTFFKTILNYSVNITLTAAWIKLLKDFNSNKYTRDIKVIPKLTLCGKWLETAGFLPNEIIYVKVEEGRLVITSYQPTE